MRERAVRGPGRVAGTTGRRAVAGLVLTAVLTFAVVGAAAYVVAHRIARADALSDSLRTAHGIGDAVLAPEIGAVLKGDRAASAQLDAAVASRREDGTLVRVTVWDRDGTVLWSDDRALMGHQFAPSHGVAQVFADRGDYAAVSTLTDPDNRDERGDFRHLVEAYVPLTVQGGRTVAVEVYFSDVQVRQADHQLSERLVPFTLLALLLLALTQLPVSIWLVRRTTAAQADRDRMLDSVLVSSERERRLLARHLHDGVVQDLAGAAMLLEARRPALTAENGRAVTVVSQTLQRAVSDLRDMLVELHPHDLGGDNLGEVIEAAATRACPHQKVIVTTRLDRPVSSEEAAFVYRCARECSINVAKHAAASTVEIILNSDAAGIRLLVRDDGVGIGDPDVGPTKGHIGLALLREATTDLGGSLQLYGDEGGTLVTITLPPSHVG